MHSFTSESESNLIAESDSVGAFCRIECYYRTTSDCEKFTWYRNSVLLLYCGYYRYLLDGEKITE